MGSSRFINQEIYMYYVVSVDNNNMAVHPTRRDCECFFKKCYTSNAVEGTDVDMLWDGSEEDGSVTSECEEDNC
jgi:hypothetical protein